MSGLMHRGMVAIKEKMNVQTVQLTRAQSAQLHQLLLPETFQVRVTPYPRTNAEQVMSMYSNNVKTTHVVTTQSSDELQSLSFPLIEL